MNEHMKANELTLTEAIEKLKRKELSLSELYRHTHEEIAVRNTALNIYLTLDPQAVTKAEKRIQLPLAGVPIAVKDNFLTVGLETTASSAVLRGFLPPYESTVTGLLQKAGGVVVGKTNMDAWAHGSSTETSDFGPTKNPLNPEYLPGGSSGGSAAAVAANMCLAAIGSETAGSIRQPASWCGVVGLKPTYGRTSRYGVVAMASSTDTPGPIGKTVADCAFLYSHIAGYDPLNATSSEKPVSDVMASMKKGVKGMRVGICYIDHPSLSGTPAATSVLDAAKVFERLGASVDIVSVSDSLQPGHMLNPDYAIGVYTIVQRGEVSSNLARYDGIRYGAKREMFGDEAKRRIMLGTFALSSFANGSYIHAQRVRNLILQNFYELFTHFDILLAPTSPGFAQKIGATKDNPMYGELEDMLLEASSVAGLPGISVPCFTDPITNLSLGLNIMGAMWQEETVVRAAYAYEQATQWNRWLS